MGADKATVRVGGMMMLERVVRAAIGAGLEVMVVGRGEAPAGWPGELRVRFMKDDAPAYSGPAAGLLRALEVAQESVVLLGCDLPLVTARGIGALVAAHEGAPAGTAATMVVREFAEPAFSVYTPEVLPAVRKIVSGERRGFQWMLGEPGVLAWRVPAEIAGELLNVNDAETLAEAEIALRGNARPG
jgi:molybdopterin-guanine dinucleotide biosynthesis protein A